MAQPRFDTTIRLDVLLALVVLIASVIAFNVRNAEHTAANSREILRTTEILDKIEVRVSANEAWVNFQKGAEYQREKDRDSDDG